MKIIGLSFNTVEETSSSRSTNISLFLMSGVYLCICVPCKFSEYCRMSAKSIEIHYGGQEKSIANKCLVRKTLSSFNKKV